MGSSYRPTWHTLSSENFARISYFRKSRPTNLPTVMTGTAARCARKIHSGILNRAGQRKAGKILSSQFAYYRPTHSEESHGGDDDELHSLRGPVHSHKAKRNSEAIRQRNISLRIVWS